jgi:hypothetical protein
MPALPLALSRHSRALGMKQGAGRRRAVAEAPPRCHRCGRPVAPPPSARARPLRLRRLQVYQAGVLARLDGALEAWGELAETRRRLARWAGRRRGAARRAWAVPCPAPAMQKDLIGLFRKLPQSLSAWP